MGEVTLVAEFTAFCGVVFVADFGFGGGWWSGGGLGGGWGGSGREVHHLCHRVVASGEEMEEVAVLAKWTAVHAEKLHARL